MNQVLVDKWQEYQEAISGLSKSDHDRSTVAALLVIAEILLGANSISTLTQTLKHGNMFLARLKKIYA